MVETGRLEGLASELISLEILSDKKLQGSQISAVLEFLRCTTVTFQAITHDVLLAAAQLRRQNPGIKTPDATHLASAVLAGATHFITNDHKLLNKNINDIELVPLAKATALLPTS